MLLQTVNNQYLKVLCSEAKRKKMAWSEGWSRFFPEKN
jgi:hypothetical protein